MFSVSLFPRQWLQSLRVIDLRRVAAAGGPLLRRSASFKWREAARRWRKKPPPAPTWPCSSNCSTRPTAMRSLRLKGWQRSSHKESTLSALKHKGSWNIADTRSTRACRRRMSGSRDGKGQATLEDSTAAALKHKGSWNITDTCSTRACRRRMAPNCRRAKLLRSPH